MVDINKYDEHTITIGMSCKLVKDLHKFVRAKDVESIINIIQLTAIQAYGQGQMDKLKEIYKVDLTDKK